MMALITYTTLVLRVKVWRPKNRKNTSTRHPTRLASVSPELRSGKRLTASLISWGLIFFLAGFARAGSVTWKRNARSGDWNTNTNWTPAHASNGSADTATFDLSNTTGVSISANTEVNGITFTAPSAPTIFVNPNVTLTISGTGITGNSGEFVTRSTGDPIEPEGGKIVFSNNSTAGNSNILNNGTVQFFNHSTAGNAFIFNSPAGGQIFFQDHSTAGNSEIDVEHDSSLSFTGNSTAGNATIGIGEAFNSIGFSGSSSAGNATIFTGGQIFFLDSSKGGTARIVTDTDFSILQRGVVDISSHNAPGVTVGSIEGNGFVVLGANNLTVGSNNLSTTSSGVIGGTGGSLTKIGSGTLTLSGDITGNNFDGGVNTYTGHTNVNSGVLQVDGSITSNSSFTHPGRSQVLEPSMAL